MVYNRFIKFYANSLLYYKYWSTDIASELHILLYTRWLSGRAMRIRKRYLSVPVTSGGTAQEQRVC